MKTTRRTFLGGAAAASLPVTAGACVAVTHAPIAENPDLLAAYARLQNAKAELREAEEALEWIADEWRHLWPLAPEELLGPAGADRHMGHAVGETDIIGNFILRDCATLTTRLSPQFRKIGRRDCFSIITSTEAQSWMENFQQRKPRGRTPEALAQSQEVIERNIREYSHRVELARAYEKETARLRKAAGVEAAKRRIEDAKEEFFAACSDVSKIPAFGPEGLLIKAEVINATGYMDGFTRSEGIVGEMARFVQQVIDMGGRVSI